MRKKLEPGLLKLAVMAICLVAAILTNSCARKPAKSQIDANAYAQELSQWQRKRWADLKSETGWLTLVGLFWLKEGENKFGSDGANEIVIPKLAAHAGSFRLEKNVVDSMQVRQVSPLMESRSIRLN